MPLDPAEMLVLASPGDGEDHLGETRVRQGGQQGWTVVEELVPPIPEGVIDHSRGAGWQPRCMVVWMRRHSRQLKGQLESAAAGALATGWATALVAMAFLAVLREGFETAVFLLAAFQENGGSAEVYQSLSMLPGYSSTRACSKSAACSRACSVKNAPSVTLSNWSLGKGLSRVPPISTVPGSSCQPAR